MPYLMSPANYTQTMRPNLYNVAYRRVGAYKGMGRLHPSNYLEIGPRPTRIGATTGQYNTLSTQLSLLPPSLRGMGMLTPRGRGLGQGDVVGTGPVGGGPTGSPESIVAQMYYAAGQQLAAGAVPAPSYGTGANIIDPSTGQITAGAYPVTISTGMSTNTMLLIAGGLLLLVALTGRR